MANKSGGRMTESELLAEIRQLSTGDVRLFRAQSGAFEDIRGNYVRVGFKGLSDLFGWRTVVIQPADVGFEFARFVAIEAKSHRRQLTPEQGAFIATVLRAGGYGGVAHTLADAERILRLHTR